MKNPKGAWRMCFAAALALFCVVGLTVNAFSVYLPYLQLRCGLSNTQSANYIMVRSLFAFGALFFVGAFYHRLELRAGIAAALTMAALSLLLYARADSFPELCLAAVVGGLAYGLGGMYPSSLLIRRWFSCHSGLALGICSAATGLAAIVGAPVVTALAERFSVGTALILEGGLLLVCAGVCAGLVRNRPEGAAQAPPEAAPAARGPRLTWMFPAVVAVGVLGNTGFQFLTMLYSERGLSAFEVSALVSVVGGALMGGKFLFGEIVDRWGACRANWLFFGMAIAGCVLNCLGGSYALAVAAMVLLGLGLAVCTVGLTVYAGDLSRPEDFAGTLRQYQIAYLLGSLLFGPVPGLLADWTGSYVPFYILVTALTVFSMFIIQRNYRNQRKVSS